MATRGQNCAFACVIHKVFFGQFRLREFQPGPMLEVDLEKEEVWPASGEATFGGLL